MLINVDTLSPRERYRLMVQAIVPRPVAWVLTDNATGEDNSRYNLAPFSYFTGISSDPALLMFSVGKKPDQSPKDTLVNIEAREHFVVHIAHAQLASAVSESSRTLPHGDSEVIRGNLEVTSFDSFPLPRLRDARIALGCQMHQLVHLDGIAQTLIFGRILLAHVDDHIATAADDDQPGAPRIDAAGLNPIGRLGGDEYVSFGEIIRVPRPR